MSTVKFIKRYNNRKLYDPEASSYITLGEIFKLVEAGTPLKVIANGSTNDITNATVLSALMERYKLNENENVVDLLNLVANYIQTNTRTSEVFVASATATPVSATLPGGINE